MQGKLRLCPKTENSGLESDHKKLRTNKDSKDN